MAFFCARSLACKQCNIALSILTRALSKIHRCFVHNESRHQLIQTYPGIASNNLVMLGPLLFAYLLAIAKCADNDLSTAPEALGAYRCDCSVLCSCSQLIHVAPFKILANWNSRTGRYLLQAFPSLHMSCKHYRTCSIRRTDLAGGGLTAPSIPACRGTSLGIQTRVSRSGKALLVQPCPIMATTMFWS